MSHPQRRKDRYRRQRRMRARGEFTTRKSAARAIAAIQKKLKNPYLKPGVALGLQMALRALGVEGGDRG